MDTIIIIIILAYTSGVCQDPVLDFSVDFWPEGVESQPVDEEQEGKWL